jgi:hypothetical protein
VFNVYIGRLYFTILLQIVLELTTQCERGPLRQSLMRDRSRREKHILSSNPCSRTRRLGLSTAETSLTDNFHVSKRIKCLSHYCYYLTIIIFQDLHRNLRGLRHELSSPVRTLLSWVRIPLEAWMSRWVYSVFVLFCV